MCLIKDKKGENCDSWNTITRNQSAVKYVRGRATRFSLVVHVRRTAYYIPNYLSQVVERSWINSFLINPR